MNLIPPLFKAIMAKGFNVPTPSTYHININITIIKFIYIF
jgi:hypothetical protein